MWCCLLFPVLLHLKRVLGPRIAPRPQSSVGISTPTELLEVQGLHLHPARFSRVWAQESAFEQTVGGSRVKPLV